MTTLCVVYFPSIIQAINTIELDEDDDLSTEAWNVAIEYSGNDRQNVNLGLHEYFQGTRSDLDQIHKEETHADIKTTLSAILYEFPKGYDYIVVQNC
jgi:hypothetical protein